MMATVRVADFGLCSSLPKAKPLSAPQAKKILRHKSHFTANLSVSEWELMIVKVQISVETDPYLSVLGTPDTPPHQTFTGLLPGVRKVQKYVQPFIGSLITRDPPDRGRRRGRLNGPNRTAGPRQRTLRVSATARRGAAAYGDAS